MIYDITITNRASFAMRYAMGLRERGRAWPRRLPDADADADARRLPAPDSRGPRTREARGPSRPRAKATAEALGEGGALEFGELFVF
jgi:hypothetical protein